MEEIMLKKPLHINIFVVLIICISGGCAAPPVSEWSRGPSVDTPPPVSEDKIEPIYDYKHSVRGPSGDKKWTVAILRFGDTREIPNVPYGDDSDKANVTDGSISIDNRKNLCETMENENNVIGVVSIGTFSTGISINNVHQIILCQVGKAPIKLIQLIGRGMRLHDNKTHVEIIDIVHSLNYVDETGVVLKPGYLKKHFKERYKIYLQEKHPVEIIKLN